MEELAMGRELRRKQAKKEGKSLEKEELIEEKQIKKLVINIIIIILVIVIIYLLSSLFITKELDWFNKKAETTEKTTEETDTDEILASEIFKQTEEDYYVYFYDFDEKESVITDIVNNKLAYEKIYKVNTSSAMNTNYVSTTSNKKAKTLKDLKVIAPTLIKISGDTITEYYEKNEITNKLSK